MISQPKNKCFVRLLHSHPTNCSSFQLEHNHTPTNSKIHIFLIFLISGYNIPLILLIAIVCPSVKIKQPHQNLQNKCKWLGRKSQRQLWSIILTPRNEMVWKEGLGTGESEVFVTIAKGGVKSCPPSFR